MTVVRKILFLDNFLLIKLVNLTELRRANYKFLIEFLKGDNNKRMIIINLSN